MDVRRTINVKTNKMRTMTNLEMLIKLEQKMLPDWIK
jgi:hypothetical protein